MNDEGQNNLFWLLQMSHRSSEANSVRKRQFSAGIILKVTHQLLNKAYKKATSSFVQRTRGFFGYDYLLSAFLLRF